MKGYIGGWLSLIPLVLLAFSIMAIITIGYLIDFKKLKERIKKEFRIIRKQLNKETGK